MPVDQNALLTMIAYHGTTHGAEGGSSSGWLLVFVLGLAATAGWLIFSELRWRDTVLTTAAAWIAGIGLMIAL